jgi:hypothetical protein
VIPEPRSTSSPHPSESTPSASGKTIQGRSTSEEGPGYGTGAIAPEATILRAALGEGSKTSIW